MAAPLVTDLGIEVAQEDGERLQDTLDGAVLWVVRRCGPFAASAPWSKAIPTRGGLVLLRVPALLTVSSATAPVRGALTVREVDPLVSSCVVGWLSHEVVTFAGTHGHPNGVPDEMRLAAILLAQHRWEYRDGLSQARRPDGYSPSALRGYDIPHAVRDLVRAVPGTVPVLA